MNRDLYLRSPRAAADLNGEVGREQAAAIFRGADLISPRDLAERWGLSRRTLDRWRKNGEGPKFYRIGRQVRYRIEDITAYETAQASACKGNDGASGSG